MRIMLLTIACLAVAGCSTPPPKPPTPTAPVVAIDRRCDAVARYARAIAGLRDIGISQRDLSAFVLVPVVQEWPIAAVQRDVYLWSEKDGPSTERRHYELCVSTGYENLVRTLREEEAVRAILVQRAEEEAVLKLRPDSSQPRPKMERLIAADPKKKKK